MPAGLGAGGTGVILPSGGWLQRLGRVCQDPSAAGSRVGGEMAARSSSMVCQALDRGRVCTEGALGQAWGG